MPDLRNVTFTPQPVRGKTIRLEYESDDVLRLEVDPDSAEFFRSGGDLVVKDAGGDVVFINDFFHSVKGVLPNFTLPDGSTVSAREFFSAYAPDIESVLSFADGKPAFAGHQGQGEASGLKLENDNDSGRSDNSDEFMQASDSLQFVPESHGPGSSLPDGASDSGTMWLPYYEETSPLLASASEQILNDIEARSGIVLTPDERMFLCKPPESGEFRETGFQSLQDCSPEMLGSLFAVEPLDLETLFPAPQHTASGNSTRQDDFMAVSGDALDVHSLLSPEEYLLLLGQI